MNEYKAKTVALFGLPISNVTMTEAVAAISRSIEEGTWHQIATANLDFARNARKDESLHRIICDCAMVLPDGAPMLWASRLFRKPLQQRVTGVDLIPELAKLSAEQGYGIFLLGSNDRNAAIAADVLQQKHPGVNIVGRYSPAIRSLHEMDDNEILARIDAANPQILLVAFGNPKQEIWLHRNRHRLHVPVAIGIGGSLDMIAGSLKRAPKWIQTLQMEWAFRMMQEPKRLLPRYASDLKALLRHLPVELFVNWRQPGDVNEWPMEIVTEQDHYILRMPEIITGEVCASVILQSIAAIQHGRTFVIDMSITTRIEADGVGCMLDARRLMHGARVPFWLSGMQESVLRVFESSSLLDMFSLAATTSEAIRLAKLGLIDEAERAETQVVMNFPHRSTPRTRKDSVSARAS